MIDPTKPTVELPCGHLWQPGDGDRIPKDMLVHCNQCFAPAVISVAVHTSYVYAARKPPPSTDG